MEAPVIFNLAQMRDSESSAYIEITKGCDAAFWNADSLCFSECDWLDYFEDWARDCLPDYDLFAFTNVAPQEALQLAKRLDDAAAANASLADVYRAVATWLREQGNDGISLLGL